MSRNFPDFLSTYAEHAKDDMCPDQFHFWAGVSIIAGAMERKIWLMRESHVWFPNLYILLVGKPAVGKTSVGNYAMTLLSELGGDDDSKKIKFISHQMSEASIHDQLKGAKKDCFIGTREYSHSSGYFYAPEASASLSEINGGGRFTNTLNNYYDCPEYHKKSLRTENIEVKNACVNMLSCTTFSFLDELLPQAVVGGGFASRLLYVVSDERVVRHPKWDKPMVKDPAIKKKLIEDLADIYEVCGEMTAAESWKQCWEEAVPMTDIEMHSLKSERMQQFLSRRITNTIKLSMVCALSGGSNRVLTGDHWKRAAALIEEAEKKLPKIVTNTAAKDVSKGIIYHIMRILRDEGDNGIMLREDLYGKLIACGIDILKLDGTMQTLNNSNLVIAEDGPRGSNLRRFRLTANPDDYL